MPSVSLRKNGSTFAYKLKKILNFNSEYKSLQLFIVILFTSKTIKMTQGQKKLKVSPTEIVIAINIQ